MRPGKEYAFRLNSDQYHSLRSAEGITLAPVRSPLQDPRGGQIARPSAFQASMDNILNAAGSVREPAPHLVVGQSSAILDVPLASLNALKDIEVILDILEGRFLRHPGDHFTRFLLAGHISWLFLDIAALHHVPIIPPAERLSKRGAAKKITMDQSLARLLADHLCLIWRISSKLALAGGTLATNWPIFSQEE